MTEQAAIPRILLIAGSARQGAYSVCLRDAARREADAAGATTHVLDLRELQLPLYDADLEARDGMPAGAKALRDVLADTDGLLFVTPEYNGFPTPLALNAFDWLSRVQAASGALSGMAVLADKPVALLATSPGPFGGMRAMALMRQYLGGQFQMLVLPQQLAVGNANEAFDEHGQLKESRLQHTVADIVRRLVTRATHR